MDKSKYVVRFLLILYFIVIPKISLADYSNFQIINTALDHDNYIGFTCKEFISHVINSHLGGGLGAGYRDCYLSEGSGIEIINEDDVSMGDVIQISYDPDPDNTDHVYTAIVLENLGNGNYKVIHSNWCDPPCYTVSITSSWNPSNWSSQWTGWSAHFYRLGVMPVAYSHTFPSQDEQGWSEGNNATFMSGGSGDSLYISVDGTNPGVKSPEFNREVYADDIVIHFRAKVTGNTSPSDPVTIYVEDQNNSWANSVAGNTVADGDWHEYVVHLSDMANAGTKQVVQFSIEMTEGSTGENEYWEIDWVRVIYTGNSTATSVDSFLEFVQLPDMNSNGKRELAVLRSHPATKQPTVTIQDASTSDVITEIYFMDAYCVPKHISTVSDANSNGSPEICVSAFDTSSGSLRKEIRDSKTGELIQ